MTAPKLPGERSPSTSSGAPVARASDGPRSGIRASVLVPRPSAIPAPAPSGAQSGTQNAQRAAVKPRTARTSPPQPANVPPASSRSQYFRSLTSTREDWPLVPESAARSIEPPNARAAVPAFGAPMRNHDGRSSLPAFLPPASMVTQPAAPAVHFTRVANDDEATLLDLAPVFAVDLPESARSARPETRPVVLVVVFAMGLVAGVVATLFLQQL